MMKLFFKAIASLSGLDFKERCIINFYHNLRKDEEEGYYSLDSLGIAQLSLLFDM